MASMGVAKLPLWPLGVDWPPPKGQYIYRVWFLGVAGPRAMWVVSATLFGLFGVVKSTPIGQATPVWMGWFRPLHTVGLRVIELPYNLCV